MLPFELAATPSQAPSANTATRDRAAADVVGLSRFELLTPRLSSVCSNQLSYRPGILFKELLRPNCSGGVPVLSKLDRRARHHTTPRARSIFECSVFARQPADAGSRIEAEITLERR